jgi:hypothetical protein
MRQTAALLGLSIMFGAANVWAQAKPCSLLTAKELSAVGATGQGVESSMPFPDGTPKGGTVTMCSWSMASGGLMMSTGKMPGVSRETILTTVNQSWSQLKTKGWTEEKKEFGAVSCFLMTPPPGDTGAPKPTSCTVVSKEGMVLSITTMGTTRVPMENVKALIDSAAGRL